MEFCIAARSLHDLVATARHAVPSSPALAVFSGVQVSCASGKVTVTGSDGETTIAADAPASEMTDAGSAVLAPKPIMTFLASLDPSAVVTVSLADADVVVSCAKLAPYRFRTVGTRFPQTLSPKGDERPCSLERLAEALAAVRSAVSRDHSGVQVVSDKNGLHLRTTDNYRLHAASIPEGSFGEFSGVVSVQVLERLAAHPPTAIVCDEKGRAIKAISPGVTVSARLLQVPFPNVEGVLAARPAVELDVEVAAVKSALSRLSSVADGAAVAVSGGTNGLRFEVANAEVGSGSEEVLASSSELSFSVDRQFLADSLAAHKTDVVKMGYSGQFAPVSFHSAAPILVTSIVMPVRS